MLGPVLEDARVPKCGHNLKFDAGVLRRYGVRLGGAICDTMLASTLLAPERPSHKLEDLALTCSATG